MSAAEERRAVADLHYDMRMIERQRARARACDMILKHYNDSLASVKISPLGKIVAWFHRGHKKELVLDAEEINALKEFLKDHAHSLRRHADSIEKKRAGING